MNVCAGQDFWSTLLAERRAQWEDFRAAGPVVEIDGRYHITDYRDIVSALHDPEVFSSALRPRAAGFDLVNLPLIPTLIDPPEHGGYREVLAPMFGPQVISEWAPEWGKQAAHWVEQVAEKGACDVLHDIITPYTYTAWHTFLGLPPQDAYQLREWVFWAQHLRDESIEHLTGTFQLLAYMTSVVRQRRANPEMPGLFSEITAALSDWDAVSTCFTVYGAGGANEHIALGYAFLALACTPSLRRGLREDPSQTPTFVDEILRLECPIAGGLQRVTTRDVTVAGVVIPAGSIVMLSVSAINWAELDRMNVMDGALKRCKHWTFGAGPHRCLAANVVRQMMVILIDAWLQRIPDFDIAAGYSVPARKERYIEGLTALPLRWP